MLEFDQLVKARRLLLTQPARNDTEADKFDLIRAIDVRFNKDKDWTRVDLDPDAIALTEYVFKKSRRIRRIEIKIVDRARKTGRAGFAEIVLAGQVKRRRFK